VSFLAERAEALTLEIRASHAVSMCRHDVAAVIEKAARTVR
jgi:hypothetical protein